MFQQLFDTSRARAQKLLEREITKVPVNRFEDLFFMAESYTHLKIRAMLEALGGLSTECARDVSTWATVHLVVATSQTFEFIKQEREDVLVAKVTGDVNVKTYQPRQWYIWGGTRRFSVNLCCGAKSVHLVSHDWLTHVKVLHDKRLSDHPNLEHLIDLTWLFKNVMDGAPTFAIHRGDECFTPRRNAQIVKAMEASAALRGALSPLLARIAALFGTELPLVNVDVFCLLPHDFQDGDADRIMAEGVRELTKRRQGLSMGNPIQACALVRLVLELLKEINDKWMTCVDFTEQQLFGMLKLALGENITEARFDECYIRHIETVVLPMVEAGYTVRSPERGPVGTVNCPIFGYFKEERVDMFMNDNQLAGTIQLAGDLTVLGCPIVTFINPLKKIEFTAASLPFSGGLVVLLGYVSVTGFSPTRGFILTNTDSVKIALSIAGLPSRAEFKKSITSLSPSMAEFAVCYRDFQLSQQLFAFVTVPLAPAMAKVLGLPKDALEDEFELTAELMGLFTKEQVPAHILAGGSIEIVTRKVAKVRASIAKQCAADLARQELKATEARLRPTFECPDYEEFPFGEMSATRGMGPTKSIRLLPRPGTMCMTQETYDEPKESLDDPLEILEGTLPDVNELNDRFDVHDKNVRPAIISMGEVVFTEGTICGNNNVVTEPPLRHALTLLDNLTKMGQEPLDVSMTIVVSYLLHFDEGVLETVVKGNMNPVERAECMAIILAQQMLGKKDVVASDKMRAKFPLLL